MIILTASPNKEQIFNSQKYASLELVQISKQNSFENLSYQMRYEWTTRSQYVLLSEAEIQQQYAYLQSELASLQEESKKLSESTSRIVTKPLHRSRMTNNVQNRQRQIENNNAILWKLRNQCDLLQRQNSPNSKEGIEAKIADTKQKIVKAKQKIKQIKHKSKVMGDNLQSGHDYYQEYAKLEYEQKGYLSRKMKLEEKVLLSAANLEKLNQKLKEIEGDAVYADSYLQQCLQTQKNQAAERNLEAQHRQRQYQIQIISKNTQSMKSTKLQKYHQLLKTYQIQLQKVEEVDQRLQKMEIKSLYLKKQLIELEQTLAELQLAAKERSRTTGSVEPRQQDLPESVQNMRNIIFNKNKQPLDQKHSEYLTKISRNVSRKKQKTSSKTIGLDQQYDNKINQTAIINKVPLDMENQMTMITQPHTTNHRSYFRTSKIAKDKTERGSKSVFDVQKIVGGEGTHIEEFTTDNLAQQKQADIFLKEQKKETAPEIRVQPGSLEQDNKIKFQQNIEEKQPISIPDPHESQKTKVEKSEKQHVKIEETQKPANIKIGEQIQNFHPQSQELPINQK